MNNLKIINKSFNFGKVFLFLIVVGLLVGVVSGADDVDANVEKVKKEITDEKTFTTTLLDDAADHIEGQLKGMGDELLKAYWNKIGELKKADGKPNWVEIDKYRNLILKGLGNNRRPDSEEDFSKVDGFVGELMRDGKNGPRVTFKGRADAVRFESKEGKLVAVGKDTGAKIDVSNEQTIPLNVRGFDAVAFKKMEKGGKGYAVHMIKGSGKDASALILNSGYVQNSKDSAGKIISGSWDVMDKDAVVGKVTMDANAKGAVYFRGVPADVDNYKFSKGNYVFNKGTGDSVVFENSIGKLKSGKTKTETNKDGDQVGFANKEGVRGIQEIGTDGKQTIDVKGQNKVGIEVNGKKLGEGTKGKVMVTANGDNLEVKASGVVASTEITNKKGKTAFKDAEGKVVVSVGANKPLKIVNGKVDGINVDRQDPGASAAGSDNPEIPSVPSDAVPAPTPDAVPTPTPDAVPTPTPDGSSSSSDATPVPTPTPDATPVPVPTPDADGSSSSSDSTPTPVPTPGDDNLPPPPFSDIENGRVDSSLPDTSTPSPISNIPTPETPSIPSVPALDTTPDATPPALDNTQPYFSLSGIGPESFSQWDLGGQEFIPLDQLPSAGDSETPTPDAGSTPSPNPTPVPTPTPNPNVDLSGGSTPSASDSQPTPPPQVNNDKEKANAVTNEIKAEFERLRRLQGEKINQAGTQLIPPGSGAIAGSSGSSSDGTDYVTNYQSIIDSKKSINYGTLAETLQDDYSYNPLSNDDNKKPVMIYGPTSDLTKGRVAIVISAVDCPACPNRIESLKNGIGTRVQSVAVLKVQKKQVYWNNNDNSIYGKIAKKMVGTGISFPTTIYLNNGKLER